MSTRLTYPPGLLRHTEAAEYLGVSPRKLDEIQSRGDLIPVEVEGMKRWRRDDLDEWIRQRADWDGRKSA